MLKQKHNLNIRHELFVKTKLTLLKENIFHMALLLHDGLTAEISPFLVEVKKKLPDLAAPFQLALFYLFIFF